jgi:TIR domain
VVERWDVFVSYAHEDEAWVRVLAENLHRAGRDVFFDRWDVVGGPWPQPNPRHCVTACSTPPYG